MRKLMFALCFAVAILLTGSWLDLSHAQKTAAVSTAAKQELLKAAKAHRVNIKADKIEYVDNQKMTIVRAPIKGIDKYSDADFEKGAPIVLMIIKSKTKLAVPDGSYVPTQRQIRQGDLYGRVGRCCRATGSRPAGINSSRSRFPRPSRPWGVRG